jgi:hypothetical protein
MQLFSSRVKHFLLPPDRQPLLFARLFSRACRHQIHLNLSAAQKEDYAVFLASRQAKLL